MQKVGRIASMHCDDLMGNLRVAYGFFSFKHAVRLSIVRNDCFFLAAWFVVLLALDALASSK